MNSSAEHFFRDFLLGRTGVSPGNRSHTDSDQSLELLLIRKVDEILDHPPRSKIDAGTTLFEQGQPVDGIWLLREGHVRLYRMVDGMEITFHMHTVGPVIGLLGLASSSTTATYSCVAVTDVTVIPITVDQLETAFTKSPELQGYFAAVLLQSLVGRQQRSTQQRVEIKRLNRQIAADRDQLRRALDKLTDAQTQLIESEKMAMLGQLAAGVAHDLNSPVATIDRSADFLAADVLALARLTQHSSTVRTDEVLTAAVEAPALSSREARRRRRELVEALDGNEALARRLLHAGVTGATHFESEFGGLSPTEFEHRLAQRELFHRIGSSLRAMDVSSKRIGGLVASLRAQARPSHERSESVDLNATMDEALLLLGHKLTGIHVARHYGDLPEITGYPAELSQVWTNLISNAADAVAGAPNPSITLTSDQPSPHTVRVRISDTGSGISPTDLDRIFEVNYTTKTGRVEFGLGIGLPIASQIVKRHRGTISAHSKPGATVFTVELPIGVTHHADPSGDP